MLDVDRFNARRRDLVGVVEAIRCQLRDQLIDRTDPLRLVDSAPVTLMTYTRGDVCQSVSGKAFFGVVTTKKGKFFGWRVHTTVTSEQVIDDWMLAPGSVPDPQALAALVEDRRELTLIGDKIYNDAGLQETHPATAVAQGQSIKPLARRRSAQVGPVAPSGGNRL